MKNKINLKKLIFILIGMFFCVIPIEAKAVTTGDYIVGFDFYEFAVGDDYKYFDVSAWYSDYKTGKINKVTDLNTIKAGETFAIAVTLKMKDGGASNATAFSIYYSFDNTVIKPLEEGVDLTEPFVIDNRASFLPVNPGIFPTAGWKINKVGLNSEDIAITFADMGNSPKPFNNTTGGPTVFVMVKALQDITESNPLVLKFFTEDRPLVDTSGESSTGTFVTMASTIDSIPVNVETVDYIPEVPASTVKTLKDLVIANGSDKYTDLSWTGGSTDTSFNSVIPASISSASLTITPFHSAASIMCSKNCTGSATAGATMTANLTGLATGSNSIEVTVTAEDGSTQIYPIDIKKLNDDTSLGSVTLTNGITLSYDSASKTYSATGVPYSTTSTNISASVTLNSNAVIDGTGTTWNVTSGAISNVLWNLTNTGATANTGTIKVNAENCDNGYASVPGNTCTTNTYTVSVSRNAPKTIATLKSLTVGGTLVTGFVPDDATKLEYTLADTTSTSITIAGAVTDNSNATIESGTGTVNLNIGDNTFNIVVKAEDGTTKNTYKIKVKRKSNVATLSALSITSSPQGTMNPASFASGTKSYTYTYDETVTSVNISATATHSEAMVQIGSDASTKGSATDTVTPTDGGTVDVSIIAEDGTTRDSYRITFAKKKSIVNTLSSLSVKDSSNKEYIISFNSATNTYNITVENDITSLNISATATSSSAKINNGTNTYTGTMNNLNFTSNSLTLTVSPEDTGAVAGTYTINVTRKKSNNANLSDLQVDSTSLTGFDGTQNGTYNLSDVDSTKASVIISYTKENNEATVAITNNGNNVTGNTVNLSEGNNTIVVAVTSQDNSKTISHTINIKKKSSVATLSGLTLTSTPTNKGVMNPAIFNSSTKTYTYTYEEDITSLSINATSTHNEANVKIGSEAASKHTSTASIDPKTMSSVTITVTAEDGHSTDTYTINFTRKKSNVNILSNLSVKDGSNNEYITSFNETTKTYNITVPHDVTSLNVSATAKSSVAKINNGTNTYAGTMDNLNFTSNSLTLTVSPEEGSDATYTINVTRTKSNNANLTDLKVDGTSISDFDGTQNGTYTLDAVGSSKDSVEISYTKDNEYADVTITNSTNSVSGNTVSLSEGNNVIVVTVTSQDNSKTISHTINIKKKSSNADLATLTVTSTPQGTLSPSFDPAKITYNYNYDRTVTTIDVAATSTHGANIVGTGTYNVTTDTKAEITVTPEDGTIKIYTVNFVQNKDSDSALSNLTVKNGTETYTLTPTFSSNVKSYSLTVPSEIERVSVEAIANSLYAKSVTVTKLSVARNAQSSDTIELDPGSNKVEVNVIAEDDSSTKYTLDITRTINTSATLTDLKVDGVQVPEFSPSKTVYNLDAVNSDKTSIEITAVGATGATVGGDTGTQNLDPGDNTFNITVDSQDGNNHATYTINIRRKLADAKITNLTSSTGATLHAGATEFAYTLDVPSGTNSVSLIPTFMTGATLKTPMSLDNIDVTTINEIRFTVQAEDTNITNEYVVTLNKLQSTNNNLASLSVDKGTLTPNFDKDTIEYTVTVGTNDDKINVSATVEDTGKATISSGTGEHTLNYGSQDIIVRVEAENGTPKEYKITVTRPKNNDTSLSDLTIDGTTITGFVATKDSYNISLPFGTTSFELNATPTDSNASILDSDTKLGTMTLTGTTGTFTFEVEAQDGTKKTYTINVTVSANNDTSIDALTVLGKTPTWNVTNNRYELTVDGETLKVSPSDVVGTFGNGASITNKDPEMNLAIGANTYKFTVTAADGTTTKEYDVYITREASTINTLDTLISDVGTFTPSFDKDTNGYKLTLPEGTTEFTISATATSKNPATTIVGTGKYTIPVTDDKVEVTVTAEDGRINTYEITVEVESSYCSIDCDFDGDGVCDLNCDTDGDGTCDINCDTDRDGKCDINCDTNGDGTCDLNCDSDGDGTCDYNCDTDGDGVCDDKCLLDKIIAKATGSYTIDNDYVLGVRTELKFDDTFKGQFDNDSTELILYLSDGTTRVATETIGTGMILKLERGGQVLDQKTIVIKGDTDGNGRITTNDGVKVVKHFLESDMLEGAYLVAAETDGNGKITTNDGVRIVKHYLESDNLFD